MTMILSWTFEANKPDHLDHERSTKDVTSTANAMDMTSRTNMCRDRLESPVLCCHVKSINGESNMCSMIRHYKYRYSSTNRGI